MIWGALIVTVLQWTVAFSLGELASRWPTSAGAYYWTYQLAPKQFRKILSYINGWLLLTAVLLTTTSVAFGMSQHIVATANIVHPEWSPPQWVYVLIAYALLVAASVPLLIGPRCLVFLETVNTYISWLYSIAHLIVLPVRAKAGRNSAKYAFTHYDPQYSGWGSGWTFFIGFLPAAYSNAAPGFVLAMTEEVHNPAVTVPRAVSYTMLPASLLISWAFLIPLTFTMPSSEILLEARESPPRLWTELTNSERHRPALGVQADHRQRRRRHRADVRPLLHRLQLPRRHQCDCLAPVVLLLTRPRRAGLGDLVAGDQGRQRAAGDLPVLGDPGAAVSHRSGQLDSVQLVRVDRRQRLHGGVRAADPALAAQRAQAGHAGPVLAQDRRPHLQPRRHGVGALRARRVQHGEFRPVVRYADPSPPSSPSWQTR